MSLLIKKLNLDKKNESLFRLTVLKRNPQEDDGASEEQNKKTNFLIFRRMEIYVETFIRLSIYCLRSMAPTSVVVRVGDPVWRNLSAEPPSLEPDCRRRATVGRAVPIYRSITVVIKSNKGKRDDRFERASAAATKCHVARTFLASCASDKTAGTVSSSLLPTLDITEVKYRKTSRAAARRASCLSYLTITTTTNTLPAVAL